MSWERIGDVMLAVVYVVGAIIAVRILLQRTSLPKLTDARRRIRVLESKLIATRSRIHLVEVEGERLLLGSGDQGVTLLRACGPAAEKEAAERPDPPAPRRLKSLPGAVLFLGLIVVLPTVGLAEASPSAGVLVEIPDSISLGSGSSAIDMLGLLTILTIAPSILLMATCFTRFVIVLAFVRQAIGVQHTPPNQVLIGLALFLTAFVMQPVADEVIDLAYDPYIAGELTGHEALEQAAGPVRHFLLSQTREEDLALFVEMAGVGPVAEPADVPLTTLLPSFLVSELRTAFEIGFVIFLPFLIIDLIVSSLLISMGMIVLPPIVVSLPFKIMLFVLADGWNLILGSLVQGML